VRVLILEVPVYETHVSVVGNLTANPVLRQTDDGRKVASFRLASTTRRWDAARSEYTDGKTSFFAVSCWGHLGSNVAESVRKGERVLVSGRLAVREYTVDEKSTRNSVDIEATAVGHDLTWGTSRFSRVLRGSSVEEPAADGRGASDDDGDGDGEGVGAGVGDFVVVDGMLVDADGVVQEREVVAV